MTGCVKGAVLIGGEFEVAYMYAINYPTNVLGMNRSEKVFRVRKTPKEFLV